jgi:hypothetical protein
MITKNSMWGKSGKGTGLLIILHILPLAILFTL